MNTINFWIIVTTVIILLILASCQPLIMRWHQEPLSVKEIVRWFEILPSLKGISYKWGGQSPEEGFDCSGLIVYLYNQIGIRWFAYEGRLVDDVNSEALYLYNSSPTFWDSLKHGDLIFFDTNGDSVMDHVVIFDRIDENGNTWIWDATTDPDGIEINAVSHRILHDMWRKRPFFAVPLKVVFENE
ncbi:MAG: C40 family peptidase [Thermotogae bacterium]|nr:C40 family peptidase [Thermotogota bacterium]